MPKKLILFAMIITALVTLLTACGGGATTTASPVTTEKPTTSAPATTSPPTTTLPTTTPPTTPPPTTPPTTTPATTTPATTTPPTTTPPPTTPVSTMDADFGVAAKMADFLFHIQLVQNYYDDGMTAMATFQVEATKTRTGSRAYRGIENVPPEFRKKLPSGGAMPAEPGSCAAAARPTVTFMTEGDKPVTPEMMIEKNLQSVPEEYVTVVQEDADSLMSYIETLVQLGDTRLAEPEGWNELLWDKLSDLQRPAESLMDYQLWNAAPDIETDIADLYYQRLVDQGAPPIVLAAYRESNTRDWFANQEATEEDALARMEIVAEMTGSAEGTVYEHRDFHLEGAGQTPEYGTQTGEGIVTYNISDYGDVEFQVTINLDEFDEIGRAIGGTAVGDAIDYEGYQVVFTFKPDGSKDGVVKKDGVEVGNLTMTVDHEKFENYIDIASGMEIPLPDDIQIPDTTTPPA